jgi:hypothetical protein
MSYIKDYMFELAEKLGKDVNEITDFDMYKDFEEKAQIIWSNKESTHEEKQRCKGSLPKITVIDAMAQLKPPISQYFTGSDKEEFVEGDVILQVPAIGSKEEYHYKLVIN